MQGLFASVAAAVVLLGIAGCQTPKRTVITLENAAMVENSTETQTLNRTVPAPKKATYFLYSSKQPGSPIYQTDLKKGDEVGFRARGDRARGIAKGIIIELDDYAEGASYEWRVEEKKQD
jgi:hypothetical protein